MFVCLTIPEFRFYECCHPCISDKPLPTPPPLDLGVKKVKPEPIVNPTTFLSEIEDAVRKIKDFKGR